MDKDKISMTRVMFMSLITKALEDQMLPVLRPLKLHSPKVLNTDLKDRHSLSIVVLWILRLFVHFRTLLRQAMYMDL